MTVSCNGLLETQGLNGAPRAFITKRLRVEWDWPTAEAAAAAPAAVQDALLAVRDTDILPYHFLIRLSRRTSQPMM